MRFNMRFSMMLVCLGVLPFGLGCPPAESERCGNGTRGAQETCDDGNTTAGDGCSATCQTEALWWCKGEPSSCVHNVESLGLGACPAGTYDGQTDPTGYRCQTYRAISGVSMGGGSASRIAANHPELFDVVGVMGTPFSDFDFFTHMIRHSHMAGFCDRSQILNNLDSVDDPENPDTFCGPVQLDYPAAPGTECQIFPSGFNSWFRGPDVGRGGGFTRNGLVEIFHDLNFAHGNVFTYNPDNALLPPGVPESWRVPLGLTGAERSAARAERCANPVVVNGLYNLEFNPDGSYPVITYCDGEEGDTGDFWPDQHRVASGPADNADGRFESPLLGPGGVFTTVFAEPGRYQFHCAAHPHSESGTRVVVEGEACDDGNQSDGDGCSARCLLEPGYTCQGTTCQNTCGNSAVEPSEQCDDGNTATGDGCSDHCTIEPGYACLGAPSTCAATCGNAAADAGERCDDGNTAAGDGCSPGCRVEKGYRCPATGSCAPLCGDGAVDEGEGCDDGNTAAGDGCSPGCSYEPGYSCTGQPSTCVLHCGDGTQDPGEVCDDGNTADGDGCTHLCALEPGYTCAGQPSACATSRCGNGALNPGERCDDGNLNPGDGCSPWCGVDPGWACSGNPSVCIPSCGNGSVDGVDASTLCNGGTGTCSVQLGHLRGFGGSVSVRPQQPLRFVIQSTHNIPIEFSVAVDYNGNGRRDYGEPVIDNSEERYDDVGVDGCASPQEDGQGGCGGGAYNPTTNPDPNGDDYDYMANTLGTEHSFRYDDGEPYRDDGLDGVPATGDYGEGDGLYSQNPYLAHALEQSPRRKLQTMSDVEFNRLDWWMDAGLRDFINSAQVTNNLYGTLKAREPSSRTFDGEPSVPGWRQNSSFWFLELDYAPSVIGKNAYLRYGDPSVCPGVDEVFGSGNHVGPGDQVLDRLYTMLTFASARMPGGDFSYINADIDQLGGPSGEIKDFARLERFYSTAISRDLDFGLVLPPNYYLEPDARFPVAYFMHGQGMDAEGLVISGIVFFTNMKESFLPHRVAENRSDWQKMILIFADGECGPTDCYTGNFYMNFQGLPEGRQYEDAFIELMRHVDATYRTKQPAMIPQP
ncbi:MAG: DUF4215 domain-containing protein [Pseudomonadota bacterium]